MSLLDYGHHGFLELLVGGEALELGGDESVPVEYEGPGFCHESPFSDGGREPPSGEVAFDLVRVVPDLDVHEVGAVAVGLLDVLHDAELRSAGAGRAVSRGGEYHQRWESGLDGLRDGQGVKVRVRVYVRSELVEILDVGDGLTIAAGGW